MNQNIGRFVFNKVFVVVDFVLPNHRFLDQPHEGVGELLFGFYGENVLLDIGAWCEEYDALIGVINDAI